MVRLKADAASRDDDNIMYDSARGEWRGEKKFLNSRVMINYTCALASAVKYKTEIRLCSRAYARPFWRRSWAERPSRVAVHFKRTVRGEQWRGAPLPPRYTYI